MLASFGLDKARPECFDLLLILGANGLQLSFYRAFELLLV